MTYKRQGLLGTHESGIYYNLVPTENLQREVSLVTTYFPALTRLAHISGSTCHWLPILHTSEKLKEAISPLIALRRPWNLWDLLIHTSLDTPTPPTDAGNYAKHVAKHATSCSHLLFLRAIPQIEDTKSEHTSLVKQAI